MNEDFAAAAEILEQAHARLLREKERQAEWVVDLEEQLVTARLLLAEATVGEAAVKRLLDGELYALNGPILDAEEPSKVPPAQPASDPLPEPGEGGLIDYTLVRAPLNTAWWRGAYIIAYPVEVETPPPPPPVETAPEAKPQGRQPAITASGQPLAQAQDEKVHAAIVRLAGSAGEVTVSYSALADETGVPQGSMSFVVRRLAEAGRLEISKGEQIGKRPPQNVYRIVGAEPKVAKAEPRIVTRAEPIAKPAPVIGEVTRISPKAAPPVAAVDRLLNVLTGAADDLGGVVGAAAEFCAAANIAVSEWDIAKGVLIRRGDLRVVSVPASLADNWILVVKGRAMDALDAAPEQAVQALAAAPATRREFSEEDFEIQGPADDRVGPVSLMNLRKNECHWPVGDAAPVQKYCGRGTPDGGQYCSKHAKAMFLGKKGRAA